MGYYNFKTQSISAQIALAGTTKLSILCVDLIALTGFDELDTPDLLSLPSGHEKKLAIPESLDKLP